VHWAIFFCLVLPVCTDPIQRESSHGTLKQYGEVTDIIQFSTKSLSFVQDLTNSFCVQLDQDPILKQKIQSCLLFGNQLYHVLLSWRSSPVNKSQPTATTRLITDCYHHLPSFAPLLIESKYPFSWKAVHHNGCFTPRPTQQQTAAICCVPG
jgi:hypothetical protein